MSHNITNTTRQICSNFETHMQSCFQNFVHANYKWKMKNGNKNVLERMHKLLIPRKIIKKIKYSENEKKKISGLNGREGQAG